MPKKKNPPPMGGLHRTEDDATAIDIVEPPDVAGMTIPQRRKWLKQQIQRLKKEEIPRLKAAIKEAEKAKKDRVKGCEKECAKVTAQVERKAKQSREKLRKHIEKARAKAGEVCKLCKVTAKQSAIDDLEKANQKLQKQIEIIRELSTRANAMVSERGRAGGRRRAEMKAESDDMVRFNLGDNEDLIGLFNSVSHTIKKTPRATRTEAFLEWVHNNPSKLDEYRARKEREYEAEINKAYKQRYEFLKNYDRNDLERACEQLAELEAEEGGTPF
jgi:hypothetical protein